MRRRNVATHVEKNRKRDKHIMKWTFGIITAGTSNLERIHHSIMRQNINDEFEIIVVGNVHVAGLEKVRHFSFDESVKPSWITKKKNMIASKAKYENICLMHDYVYLKDGWYDEFVKFGEEWDVCMNSIVNHDGQRFRDWITWKRWCPENTILFLDYDDHSRTDQMYVSGTYFCVKKQFFLSNPLDEELTWGHGEDVEWCSRIRKKWNYVCNKESVVSFMKLKDNAQWHREVNSEIRARWNSL